MITLDYLIIHSTIINYSLLYLELYTSNIYSYLTSVNIRITRIQRSPRSQSARTMNIPMIARLSLMFQGELHQKTVTN